MVITLPGIEQFRIGERAQCINGRRDCGGGVIGRFCGNSHGIDQRSVARILYGARKPENLSKKLWTEAVADRGRISASHAD